MNYDLAKQLKDAGFPQKGVWGISHKAGTGILLKHSTLAQLPELYCPTLSELISECFGNDLDFQLVNTTLTEHWNATNRMKTGNGNTPEEAVARLWLALNKKP